MTDGKNKTGQLEPAKSFNLAGLVGYSENAVVSRTIKKSKVGTMTIFSFDAGQELSEHTAPFDAFVQVLDGEVRLAIGGNEVVCRTGEIVMMPADIPHAVYADKRFKMLLTMIKEPKE